MVTMQEVENQLQRIGATFRYFGRPELRELPHILVPGEQIQGAINGRYEGGFALLCATDQRILLIDKKPFYLTVEDVRYDMVAEVDYGHRMLDATLNICTPNKVLKFTAYKQKELRAMATYMQQRVMEVRQQYSFHHMQAAQQQFATGVSTPAPVPTTPEPTIAAIAQPMLQEQPPVQTSGPVPLVPDMGQGAAMAIPALPIPGFTNPYVRSSLIMRKRVSRFNPISPR